MKRSMILVLGAAIVVNLSTLRGGFVWDDYNLIVENHWIKSLANLQGVFTHDFFNRVGDDVSYGYYRPMVTASYVLNYQISGLEPFGYHLTNVLLHSVSSLLLLLILLRMEFSREAATAAAVLFAVHPIHTENVAWISGRTDLVAFFFCALALLLHLHGFKLVPVREASGKRRKKGRKKRRPVEIRKPRWHRLIAAALLFGLALLAKEMSVVLIPWIVLVHLFAYRETLKRTLACASPSIAVFAAYAAVRFLWLHVAVPPAVKGHTIGRILLGLPELLVRYLAWLLFPFEPNAYVVNGYIDSPLDWRFLGSALLIGLASLFIYRLRSRRRLLLCAGMLLVSFGPIANIVRIAGPLDMGNVMAERFCYFPSFPFLALLAGLAAPLLKRRRLTACSTVLLVAVVFGYATLTRNLDWHDELTFFRKTLDQNPETLLLMVRLAGAEVRNGQLEEAHKTIADAKRVAPRNPGVLTVEAAYYVARRQFEKAVPIQEDLVAQIDFGRVRAENNLAFLYAATGKEARAETIWRELIAGGHGYSVIYYNVAEIEKKRGDLAEARSYYERAFRERPHDRRYAAGLAGTLEALGQYDDALSVYRTILRLYPDDPRLLNNQGAVHQEMGNVDGAIASYRRAASLDPGYAMAVLNLADALRLKGSYGEAELQLRALLARSSNDPKVLAAATARLTALQREMNAGDRGP